jgi:methyl coenzyme M reductase beta subunit
MITTEEIESLGWKFYSTARNGGSKGFCKGNYMILSHADNFISKKEDIKITKIDTAALVVWEGVPKDLYDLKRILVENNIDMEWLPEIRDEKITKILD